MAGAMEKAQKRHENTDFVVPVARSAKEAAVSNQATKGEGFMHSPEDAKAAAESNQFGPDSPVQHEWPS